MMIIFDTWKLNEFGKKMMTENKTFQFIMLHVEEYNNL